MIVALFLAIALGYPLLVGGAILFAGLVHHRSKLRGATEAARSAFTLGYSRDAVIELLLHYYRLPSAAVVRAISSAAGLRPAEARAIVLPHLTRRQRDALARVPAARFERLLERFYPA